MLHISAVHSLDLPKSIDDMVRLKGVREERRGEEGTSSRVPGADYSALPRTVLPCH